MEVPVFACVVSYVVEKITVHCVYVLATCLLLWSVQSKIVARFEFVIHMPELASKIPICVLQVSSDLFY